MGLHVRITDGRQLLVNGAHTSGKQRIWETTYLGIELAKCSARVAQMHTYSIPAATLPDDLYDSFLAEVLNTRRAGNGLIIRDAHDKYAQCQARLAQGAQQLECRPRPYRVGVEITDIGQDRGTIAHQRKHLKRMVAVGNDGEKVQAQHGQTVRV